MVQLRFGFGGREEVGDGEPEVVVEVQVLGCVDGMAAVV